MATQLYNVVSFAAVGPGASQTLAHGLNIAGRAVIPDDIACSDGSFSATADATNITVTNTGSASAGCNVSAEYRHSITRINTPGVIQFPGAPFQGGGVPFQAMSRVNALRVTRQSSALVHTIYARPGGSDVTGIGTLASPFATITKAILAVPRAYDGVRYVVDCTGVNELISSQFVMPDIFAPGSAALDAGAGGAFNPWISPLTIIATPTIIQSLTLTGQTADPTTGLKTLEDTTQAWTPNEHVGRMVQGNGFFQQAVIASNTATTLEVANSATFSDPVQIVEPSASLELTDAVTFNSTILLQAQTDTVFSGIAFRHANPSSFAVSMFVRDAVHKVVVGLCSFQGMDALQAQVLADACWFTDRAGSTKEIFTEGAQIRGRWCYFDNQELRQYGSGGTGTAGHFRSIFNDCTPLGHGGNLESDQNFEITSCAIRNAKTDGVLYSGGGRCSVRTSTINDSVGDAIMADGPGMLQLINVQGSGNGGFGANAVRGAALFATTGTGVTGTSGDVSLGGIAGATAWAAAPTNDLGAATPQGCFIY